MKDKIYIIIAVIVGSLMFVFSNAIIGALFYLTKPLWRWFNAK